MFGTDLSAACGRSEYHVGPAFTAARDALMHDYDTFRAKAFAQSGTALFVAADHPHDTCGSSECRAWLRFRLENIVDSFRDDGEEFLEVEARRHTYRGFDLPTLVGWPATVAGIVMTVDSVPLPAWEVAWREGNRTASWLGLANDHTDPHEPTSLLRFAGAHGASGLQVLTALTSTALISIADALAAAEDTLA